MGVIKGVIPGDLRVLRPGILGSGVWDPEIQGSGDLGSWDLGSRDPGILVSGVCCLEIHGSGVL